MLEYSKIILAKVSFDPYLFKKELIKAIQCLNRNEAEELVKWIKMNYSEQKDILYYVHDLLF